MTLNALRWSGLVITVLASIVAAAEKAPATKPADKVLAGTTTPDGFELTLFAQPPVVHYATCLTTTPRGEVFVGIDEQGSLGREANRGRIVRCIDTDNDGVADDIKTFAEVDHPRGLIWDDAQHCLYVLHPPTLTRYDDTNNDGVADKETVIVKGIGNVGVQDGRGADHSTNGIRMGIDGWIYVAMGDFGAPDAVGTDGTHVEKHGGGILRVRPDGSGLEIYVSGTRNIYDVAIDPVMNVFTRDNTNDGDGWNDRLAYDVPSGYYGYPSRFRNFPGDFIDCMIDFGGGSPCGSIFIDEPGLPKGLGYGFFTVEWGRNEVDHHPLTADGAGFKATTDKLMDLPRGTDIDVDGSSRLYLSSWANGGFNFSGPDVGYVIRLKPKGYEPPAFPDLAKASDEDLIKHLGSKSAVLRTAAQQEILHRGEKPAFTDGLTKLANSDAPIAARSAAIFTLKLVAGGKANDALVALCAKPEVRELAIRALADRKNDKAVNAAPIVDALKDTNPRVRLIAAWGLARLGKVEAADKILPLTNDKDGLVAHVATTSIVTLDAVDAALKDLSGGALKALAQLHEPRVVDGLGKALDQTQDPAKKQHIYSALARLYFKEGKWDGQWWGTRPDTTGPYFNTVEWEGTPAVKALIIKGLAGTDAGIVRQLVLDCSANHIDLPQVDEQVGKLADSDPAFRKVMLKAWLGKVGLSSTQVATVLKVAQSDDSAVNVDAMRVLARDSGTPEAIEAVMPVLAKVAMQETPDANAASAVDAFVHEANTGNRLPTLRGIIQNTKSSMQRELALAAVLDMIANPTTKGAPKKNAEKLIDGTWKDVEKVPALLRAIARAHAKGYDESIRRRTTSGNSEIAAAATYAAKQLGLDQSAAKASETIEAVGFEKTVEMALKTPGDATKGQALFTKQGCVACHTVNAEEPPKGPFLGGISARYKRSELCESVLKPSAKISQGFETQWFKTKTDVLEGFVTRESGDEVEFRNVTGQTTTLKKADIKDRGKREISVMPEGLVAKVAPEDLANLMAYLESLKAP